MGIDSVVLGIVPGYKEVGGTSQEAADSMVERAKDLRELTLECIKRHGPLTADEVASKLGVSILAIRPRCSELFKVNALVKTNIRRLNRSGKMAVAYAAS